MNFKCFEELPVWKQSRVFVKEIYSVCVFRDFYLKDQVRRAAVSILLNIAEGFERKGNKDFARFINQAKASAGEVRCGLYLAMDLKLIEIDQFKKLHDEAVSIGKQLSRFQDYLISSCY